MGEFLYFLIYVLQQLGVMLGLGAQVVLLCAHLVTLHRQEQDTPHAAFTKAAHIALGSGLFLVITSGLAAVMGHMLAGELATLVQPAFLFKWLLIGVLWVAFFIEPHIPHWSNTFYAFTGATWSALFLVHSIGPITTWLTLWVLYILWVIVFGLVWAFFIALLKVGRHLSTPQIVRVAPVVIAPPIKVVQLPPPVPTPAPIAVVIPQVIPPITPVLPTPPPLPIPIPPVIVPPLIPPPPVPKKLIHNPLKMHPLPALRPLSLPGRAPSVPTRVPVPVSASLMETNAKAFADAELARKNSAVLEAEYLNLVPPLRVMPQRPEDIDKHNRPAVVK